MQSVVHNHTREPHTTHTTPNMDMDNEIESIDNQSEEVAVVAAAAAASIMISRTSFAFFPASFRARQAHAKGRHCMAFIEV